MPGKRSSRHTLTLTLTCKETIVLEVLGAEKGASFLKDRAEYQALKKRSRHLCSAPIRSLAFARQTERGFFLWRTLSARLQFSPKFLMRSTLQLPVKSWYASGKGTGKLKDALLPVFCRLLGTEGDLFYGIKVRRTSLMMVDIGTSLLSLAVRLKNRNQRKR